ncbi:hypothetical protein INR49_003570 [Caranx melampygus]|nr:hypothetical protein INR49_003570 [Caranx melampygus]
MKLKGKPDGSFLVRDSSDPRYILSLSFRSQGVTHHTRMEHYRGTFSLWCHPKFEDRCHSVVEFIERAIMHSKNGKFLYFLRSRVPGLPPTPVQLLYPVSRFSSVKSLQHLCRFCIRQLVRIDHIQELPLPMPLISYLRKFYYYDPEEEISPPLKERRAEQSSQPGLFSFLCFLLVFLGLKNAQTFRLDSHSQPISSLRSLLCPAEFQMIRPPPPGSPIGSWGVNREGTGDVETPPLV